MKWQIWNNLEPLNVRKSIIWNLKDRKWVFIMCNIIMAWSCVCTDKHSFMQGTRRYHCVPLNGGGQCGWLGPGLCIIIKKRSSVKHFYHCMAIILPTCWKKRDHQPPLRLKKEATLSTRLEWTSGGLTGSIQTGTNSVCMFHVFRH